MLKKVKNYIDSIYDYVMFLHTYIHTGLTLKITTYYIREEVCLLFKHISFLYTSCKGGINLGDVYE